MIRPKSKIYLDTSAMCAYYDDRQPERMTLTQKFWKQTMRYEIFISKLVVAEIDKWEDPGKIKLQKLIQNFHVLSVDNKNVVQLTNRSLVSR